VPRGGFCSAVLISQPKVTVAQSKAGCFEAEWIHAQLEDVHKVSEEWKLVTL
jgi:hypothetical protein